MKRREIAAGGLYCDGRETRKVIHIAPRDGSRQDGQRMIYKVLSGPRPHLEHEILMATFLKFARFRSHYAEAKFMEPTS